MTKPAANRPGESLFKSVMLSYFVLVLHVVLIVGLGLLVIFFRGIIQYMLWIFLGGSAVIAGSGYVFYKRMKAEGKTVRQMLKTPLLNGRPVEVSLLGGLASFRVGPPSQTRQIEAGGHHTIHQLEDPDAMRIREVNELAKLLDRDLITRDEFEKAKRQILK